MILIFDFVLIYLKQGRHAALVCDPAIDIGYDIYRSLNIVTTNGRDSCECGPQAQALLELSDSWTSNIGFPNSKHPKQRMIGTRKARPKIKTGGNTLATAGAKH